MRSPHTTTIDTSPHGCAWTGSREAQALLECVRFYFSPDAGASTLTEVSSGIDWQRVAGLAAAHRVEPLLFQSLVRLPNLAPAPILGALRGRVQAITFRNLKLTRELLHLVELCEARGIEVLPLKGPVVAQQLYGNLNLRMFGDLDILVRPPHVRAAERLLTEAGYDLQLERSAWKDRLFAYKRGHHHVFLHPGKDVAVELHWRIMPRMLSCPIETEDFWRRLARCSVAAKPVACNGPEDLLLILGLHGARHGWSQLNWIADIAALLRTHPDLDWSVLRERARQTGTERMLRLCLRVVHEVLEVEIPVPVRACVEADEVVGSLADDVKRRLFLNEYFDMHGSHSRQFFTRMRERWRDRVRFNVAYGLHSFLGELTPEG